MGRLRRQLRLVEPRPSVIESPRITSAALGATASTSMAWMKYQWSVVAASGKLAAPTELPLCRKEVVREPG